MLANVPDFKTKNIIETPKTVCKKSVQPTQKGRSYKTRPLVDSNVLLAGDKIIKIPWDDDEL